MKPRIAIIGTGIAGLGAAYQLRHHAELTFYERESHLGGHACTVEITDPENGARIPIDTGFMVYNEITYPRLTRLFRELAVPTHPTDMSFSVSHGENGLEYHGSGCEPRFAQRRNMLRPRYWKFLSAIHRFNHDAARDRLLPVAKALTLHEYVKQGGYGDDFLDLYLIPMSSAVWSTPPEQILFFPAATLIGFFHNHGFLGRQTRHPWRTVTGGAREYVTRIVHALGKTPVRIRPAASGVMRKSDGGVVVQTADGQPPEHYDRVILATQADEALSLLHSPTNEERSILGEFRYRTSLATLHTDAAVMPRKRAVWAAWNYSVRRSAAGELQNATHYWMNRMHRLETRQNYFVTLNHPESVDPAKVLANKEIRHPLFTLDAIRVQHALPKLNRSHPHQTVFFAGSYFRNGFHEDGLLAGIDAANAIEGKPSPPELIYHDHHHRHPAP